jgi:hypothetical protein
VTSAAKERTAELQARIDLAEGSLDSLRNFLDTRGCGSNVKLPVGRVIGLVKEMEDMLKERLQRAELAEARVKELEGELREAKATVQRLDADLETAGDRLAESHAHEANAALGGTIIVDGGIAGKWAVAVSEPEKPKVVRPYGLIYRFVDENGRKRFAGDIHVERRESGCEIRTFYLEPPEFADAVAKLAKAVKP